MMLAWRTQDKAVYPASRDDVPSRATSASCPQDARSGRGRPSTTSCLVDADMEDSISTSVGTLRGLPVRMEHSPSFFPSPLLSDYDDNDNDDDDHDPEREDELHLLSEHEHDSSAPDSPASSSSFPSLSSSAFFSSAPDVDGQDSSDHHDATSGLIIPSLTLPPALRHPTSYGQNLGSVRLLVVGRNGVGKSLLASVLLDRNEDVVEVGAPKDVPGGRLLRASTYWIEEKDEHGLEHFEPARNVELVELNGYEGDESVRVTFRLYSYFRLIRFLFSMRHLYKLHWTSSQHRSIPFWGYWTLQLPPLYSPT
jgi:hypothetical protein